MTTSITPTNVIRKRSELRASKCLSAFTRILNPCLQPTPDPRKDADLQAKRILMRLLRVLRALLIDDHDTLYSRHSNLVSSWMLQQQMILLLCKKKSECPEIQDLAHNETMLLSYEDRNEALLHPADPSKAHVSTDLHLASLELLVTLIGYGVSSVTGDPGQMMVRHCPPTIT